MKSLVCDILEKLEYHAQSGESDIVHHSSNASFDKFRPLSHFGTHRAAREISRSTQSYEGPAFTYSARLKLGNVMKTKDHGRAWNGGLLNDLLDNGKLTTKEWNHHRSIALDGDGPDKNAYVASVLRSKGIHSIEYHNRIEDIKGGKSYIITHPDQVRILKKSEYAYISPTKSRRS